MTLGEVIKKDHNHGVDHFRNGRIPSKVFNKYLQSDIVYDHATNDHSKVAKELRAPAEVRTLEDHKHTQVKSNRQGNQERNEKCRDVWFECYETQMKYLFVKKEIIGNKVNKKGQGSVDSSTSCVVIGLQRHEFFKERIKHIQHPKNRFSHLMVNPLH